MAGAVVSRRAVPDSDFVDSGSLCFRVYVVRGFSYAGFSARLWFVDSCFHGNDEAGRRQRAVPLAGDKPQRYRPPPLPLDSGLRRSDESRGAGGRGSVDCAPHPGRFANRLYSDGGR